MNERKRILKKRIKELQKVSAETVVKSKEYKSAIESIQKLEDSKRAVESLKNSWMKKALDRNVKIHELENELEKEKNEYSFLREYNNSYQSEVDELKAKIKDVADSKEYWYDQAMCLSKKLNEKSDQLVELTKQKEAFEKKSRILEAELNADKKIIADYTSEIGSQEEKVINLNKYILELKERIQELNKTIRDKDEIISDKTKDVKYWEDAYKNEKDKPLWKKVFRRG
nr:hypothetical protein [uncultured Cellulosilyticum sp.]